MDIFDDAGGLLGMDLDTISGEDLFAFRIEKCRIYADYGVSQTPM